MLSVVPIKSSSISTGYYLSQDGGYYIENSAEKQLYSWFGKGASSLGLTGEIEAKDLFNIFTGELPDGTKMGKRDPDGSFIGRPGYDLTFSANKEISLMISCSTDSKLKSQLTQLHHSAIKESMGYLERLISARKTTHGVTKYEVTSNMVSALCTHFTSRAGDPDLHTHALLANMTQCTDGKWRALSTDMSRQQGIYETIRDNSKLLGHIYQNHMEQGVNLLGFITQSIYKHGMFKIVGFDEKMKRHFSKRREDMISKVGNMTNATIRDKELMNKIAANKPSKKDYAIGDFEKKARNDMECYIKDSRPDLTSFEKHIENIKSKQVEKTAVGKNHLDHVRSAIDYLSLFSTKLQHHKIVEKTLQNAKDPISLKDIESAIVYFKEKEYLKGHGEVYETKENQLNSQRLTESAAAIKDKLKIIKQPNYTKEAQQALDELIQSIEKDKKIPIVIASNNYATLDHNVYARSKQTTIWQKLVAIGKSDRAISINTFLNQSDRHPLNNKHVLIIDDAQRCHLSHVQKLIDRSQQSGCQLIFSEFDQGRRSQLAGNALSLLKEVGVPYDHTKKTKENVCDIQNILCQPADQINKTKESEFDEKKEALIQKSITTGFHKSDIIVASNKEKTLFTSAVRATLNEKGSVSILHDKGVYLNGKSANLHAGMFIREYAHHGNFTYREIKRVDRKNDTVIIDGMIGREKRLRIDHVMNKFIVKRENIEIRDQERITISRLSPSAKRYGIIKDAPYQVAVNEKGLLFLHNLDNLAKKPIKIKSSILSGATVSYDYVKTINQLSSQKKSTRLALVSVPAYGSFKREVADIKRGYHQAELYCQNTVSYKKLINDHMKVNKDLGESKTCLSDNPIQNAVEYAIESVSSRNTTFTVEDITKKSLEYGVESKSSVTSILSELRMKIKRGDVAYKKASSGSVLLATQASIHHESSIIHSILEGKNKLNPYINHHDMDKKMFSPTLTQGQQAACRMMASTTDKFNMVQGYAGTGKSTMLKTLIDNLFKEKILTHEDIIALAPTHRAVKELSEKGIEAKTLQRFLVDHTNHKQNYDGKLILIDEMSMIGTESFKDFMSIVEKDNAKCVFLGDNNQLQPVPSGTPSTLAYISKEANINHAVMDEIKRQDTPYLKEAVSHLTKHTMDGLKVSFDILDKAGSIIQSPLRADAPNLNIENTSINMVASQYTKMPIDDRKNSMIITPTNALRHEINDAVRSSLKHAGELKGKELGISIYEDSGLTDRELRHSKNYQIENTIKYNGEHGRVTSIDHTSNQMVMNSAEGKTRVINLNDKNSILEKYTVREINLQTGDEIKWTKTDYDRSIIAHDKLHVLAVNPENRSIDVKDEQGAISTIDMKLHQNRHLDYAYASTVNGAQGATVKHALAVFDSKSRQANSIESMYVTITRATHNVTIYTQDKAELLRSIELKKETDQIALRAFNKLNLSQSKINHAKPLNIKEIKQQLNLRAEQVCSNILGHPNKSLSSKSNWRYGAKGALSVFVTGEKQGFYKNFETGEGGDLIKLIMDLRGIDFKAALEQASNLLGYIPSGNEQKISQPSQAISPVKVDAEKLARMQHLVDRSVPIAGTVADKYLKSRGINPGNQENIRMLSRVNTGFKNNQIRPFASALLSISKDSRGQMKAIQMTYLDPMTGQKMSDLPIPKRSMGSLNGSIVELKTPQNDPQYCFAAEGIETGLSIKNALESLKNNDATVVATLGVSNFSHLDKTSKAQNIVLILDNDGAGAQSEKIVSEAISKLEASGKTVLTMKPEMLNEQKTDYNDLLQAGKMKQITADIERVLCQKEINSDCENNKNPEQKISSSSAEITKNPTEDREIFG